MPVLIVRTLRKLYGATVAVDDVSFTIGPGETVGLLGPNGAGKTTTINMILGVLEPTSGSVSIEGRDVTRERPQALQRTNFAAVYAPLPGNLTVMQNLMVFARIYGVPNRAARVDAVIGEFDLGHFRHVKCGVLSVACKSVRPGAYSFQNAPDFTVIVPVILDVAYPSG